MNALRRFGTQNKVAKNTFALLSAQIITRVMSIVYIIVLARYVGSDGIGKLSTASALNAILVLLAGPGLETLLIRDVAPHPDKAADYTGNVLIIRAIASLPFFALLAIVTRLGGYPRETQHIIIVYAVVYLCDAFSQVPISVFRAYERMEYEAVGQIVRHLLNIVLSLAAIALKQSLLTIALVSALASAAKLLLMVIILLRNFVRPRVTLNLAEGWSLLKTSLPFGILLILHTIHAQVGTFILSLYQDADRVGAYSAAAYLLGTLLLVPITFSSAIFPTFSRMYTNDTAELQQFYRLCYKVLVITGFPLGLGTILMSNQIIHLVYDTGFEEAAGVLRIMSFQLFLFVSYSNGPLLSATGRQQFFAWTTAIAVIANVGLCFLLAPRWGPNGAAVAFMLSGLVAVSVHSIVCHRQVHLQLPWATMGRVALATVFMGVITVLVLHTGFSWFATSVLVAPAAYALGLLVLRVIKRDELKSLASAAGSN